MPILSTQFTGQAQTPDGSLVGVPPQALMMAKGPCVQATITVAQSIAEQLLQKGDPVPSPVTGLALIDTGSSVTCIDDAIAQQLQLPVVDVVNVASATHASTQQNVYPVRIEIIGSGITIDAPRALGAALTVQGIAVLIGRDVLQHCTLFYNGPNGQITLSI